MKALITVFLVTLLMPGAIAANAADDLVAISIKYGDVGRVVLANMGPRSVEVRSVVLTYERSNLGKGSEGGAQSLSFEHGFLLGVREAVVVVLLPLDVDRVELEIEAGGRRTVVPVSVVRNAPAWMDLSVSENIRK